MKRYSLIGLLFLAALFVIGGIVMQHKAAAPAPVQNKPLYIALGDSVAAGVGLKDDSDASACNRTNHAYPNLVAKALNYKLQNLACSGATLPAGILGSQDVNQLVARPQLQQLFSGPKPNLITVTIGANDANWTSLLSKCYSGECGSAADTSAVTANLQTVTSNLKTMLTQIQAQYPTATPKIVLTGYHQLFPTTASQCADATGLNSSELAWGRQLQTSISQAIATAVNGYNFASYVPINFDGHELCSNDSWVQGLSDKQPYHPTAAGQADYAKQIVATLRAGK